MTEAVIITEWTLTNWGRASGIHLPVPSKGLTVIYGNNETGKSSIASALAWMLAWGAKELHLPPFAEHGGNQLEVALTATIGARTVNLTSKTTVPKNRDNRVVKNITISGDIDGVEKTETELRYELGGLDYDSFRGRYFTDAFDVVKRHDKSKSMSELSVFDGVDTNDIAKGLRKTAYDQKIGRSAQGTEDYRDTAWALAVRAKELKKATEAVDGPSGPRERERKADRAHASAKRTYEEARDQADEMADKITLSGLAKTARRSYDDFCNAELGLKNLEKPSPDQRQLYENQIPVDLAIQRWDTAKTNLDTARKGEKVALDKVPEDWKCVVDSLDTNENTRDKIVADEERIALRRREWNQAKSDLAAATAAIEPLGDNTKKGIERVAGFLSLTLTSVVLGIATLLMVADDRITAAIALGGATVLCAGSSVLWYRQKVTERVAYNGSTSELAAQEARKKADLTTDLDTMKGHLTSAGVPEVLIKEGFDHYGDRLREIANAQNGGSTRKTAEAELDAATESLSDLLPSGISPVAADSRLSEAVERVRKYEKQQNAARDLEVEFNKSTRGRVDEVRELLESNNGDALERLKEGWEQELEDLEEAAKKADEAKEDLATERALISAENSYQADLLELEAAEKGAVASAASGLAHLLAAKLIEDRADDYIDRKKPVLRERIEELATGVADTWTGVRFKGHHLHVTVDHKEFSESHLSAGAQSLLYLAVRLASVESESEEANQEDDAPLRVKLPVILDDALGHMDCDRQNAAFEMLFKFAEERQVLYFTPNRPQVELAQKAGAALIEL